MSTVSGNQNEILEIVIVAEGEFGFEDVLKEVNVK